MLTMEPITRRGMFARLGAAVLAATQRLCPKAIADSDYAARLQAMREPERTHVLNGDWPQHLISVQIAPNSKVEVGDLLWLCDDGTVTASTDYLRDKAMIGETSWLAGVCKGVVDRRALIVYRPNESLLVDNMPEAKCWHMPEPEGWRVAD